MSQRRVFIRLGYLTGNHLVLSQRSSMQTIFQILQDLLHSSHRDQLNPESKRCAKGNRFLAPKLSVPRSMNEALFRPFRYCYRTWKDGIVAFRREHIETSRHWNDLGFTARVHFLRPHLRTKLLTRRSTKSLRRPTI